MTTDMDKIMDRVRKMHAKAESAREIGSIHEAETFAAAVQKMLEAHKLEMSDIEIAAQDHDDPMGDEWADFGAFGIETKGRRVAWSEALASVVAYAHYCELLISRNSNRICFVGRRSDRKLAEYMFATLYRMAERMADKAYTTYFYKCRDELGDVTQARGYRQSWLTGFVSTIGTRYREQHTSRGAALVRARAQVKEYVANMANIKNATANRMKNANQAGAVHGAAAGGTVSLSPNAVDGPQDSRVRRLNG